MALCNGVDSRSHEKSDKEESGSDMSPVGRLDEVSIFVIYNAVIMCLLNVILTLN